MRRPAPPAVRNEAWTRGPIDAFILSRIEASGLAPSPEADRATLVLFATGAEETVEELMADVVEEMSRRVKIPEPDSDVPEDSPEDADESASGEGSGVAELGSPEFDDEADAGDASDDAGETNPEDGLENPEDAEEEDATEEAPPVAARSEEEPSGETLRADVREPVPARYIVRGQRRVRRRGGREPRGESREGPRPGRLPAGAG